MKSKLKGLVLLAATSAAMVASASAAITTTEAEGFITDAVTKSETIGVAGLAIAGVWLAIAILKKGIARAK